jgi:single-stranded-DNA-specific exonuclease
MSKAYWKIASVDRSSVKRLEYGLGISRVASKVLVARGFTSETEARRFLEPKMSDLHDAMLLPDIQPALDRLTHAVDNDDHVMVIGHDDVDGITSTAIIFGGLKQIGVDVSYYIPDSPTEGIGLSKPLVDRFKKSGVSLIITVDCGVSCKDEIAYANTLGIDTIVTDHHEPPAELPPAVAVVNAKCHDSQHGFRDLAGCGVAYRFLEAFTEHYRKMGNPPSLDGALAMTALGTVADRVPLLGDNRIIVYNGVRELLSKRLLPFVTLRSHIWVDDEATMTEVLSKIIPMVGASRSNEGGNLGCELLLATEEDDAEEIFSSLVMECERKRDRARKTLQRVLEHLSEPDIHSLKAVVHVEENLPNKTVGFCAARIADDLHKPVIIIAMKGEIGIGEARGPKGVDLVEALAAHKEYFLSFGGHKQAAGFSIERSKVSEFTERFAEYLEATIEENVIRKEIAIDGKLGIDQLNLDSLRSLLCLEPFGEENRRPVFLLEYLRGNMFKEIDGSWRLGDVVVSGEGFPAGAISSSEDSVNLVVSPFGNGSVRVIEVIDWKKAKPEGRE